MPTRPVPQDHKRSAAELAEERYQFVGEDGKTYKFPDSSVITGGMIRKSRHLSELDMSFTILEQILEPDVLEALDNLPQARFNEVLSGWNEHIGVSSGKSGSSAS